MAVEETYKCSQNTFIGTFICQVNEHDEQNDEFSHSLTYDNFLS